ncbi:hypothetical protein ACIQXA_33625 [Streptomyces massasporeus]|uniref:hypothetical protein n=1 Tax=Streptomyces massasporeus TaxID=67324 RepID=UPI003805A7F6
MPRTSGQGGQVDGGTAARIAAGLRSGAMARLLSRLSTLNIVEGSVRPAAQAFLTAPPAHDRRGVLPGLDGWRSLLPGALPAGIGTVLLSLAARVLVPMAMARSMDEFGPLGPVFTFLPWLIAVFLAAVAGLAPGEYVASTTWYRTSALRRMLTRAG